MRNLRLKVWASRGAVLLISLGVAACTWFRPSVQPFDPSVPPPPSVLPPESLLLVVEFGQGLGIDLRDRSMLRTDPAVQSFERVIASAGGRWRVSYPRTLARIDADSAGRSTSAESRLRRFVNAVVERPSTSADIDSLIASITAISGVARAYRPSNVVTASSSDLCPLSTRPPSGDSQWYLKMGRCGGMGIESAWRVPGGAGEGSGGADAVRVLLVDDQVSVCHEDLPHIERLRCQWVVREHGTRVAGVIGALNNGTGVTGLAHGADLYFASFKSGPLVSGLQCALDLAVGLPSIEVPDCGSYTDDECGGTSGCADAYPPGPGFAPPLREGDVVVLPLAAELRISDTVTKELPVEIDADVLALIQVLTERGIIVVEASANDGTDIDDYLAGGGVGEDDSGAIIVGAGVPLIRRPVLDSNHGDRVDCQAWGNFVGTTDIPDPAYYCRHLNCCDPPCLPGDPAATDDYLDTFGSTSAATAIIGGVVASLQGAYKAAYDDVLSPEEMRSLLRTGYFGHPQLGYDRAGDVDALVATVMPPSASLMHRLIGPQPDVRRLLRAVSVMPEAYVRDSLEDCYRWGTSGACGFSSCGSEPLYGATRFASPDIVPQAGPLPDPEATLLSPAAMCDANPAGSSDPDGAGDATKVTHVYVRVENRGANYDDLHVHMFWGPPSTSLGLSELTGIGELSFADVPPGGRRVGVVEVPEGLEPTDPNASWVALLYSSHDSLYMLDAVWLMERPSHLAEEYYALRYRNVGHIDVVGAEAALMFSMGGARNYRPDDMYDLHVDSDLPEGSAMQVRMLDQNLTLRISGKGESVVQWSLDCATPSVPDAEIVVQPGGRVEIGGISIPKGSRPEVNVQVSVPTGASGRDYQISFAQHAPGARRADTLVGRYTFNLRSGQRGD